MRITTRTSTTLTLEPGDAICTNIFRNTSAKNLATTVLVGSQVSRPTLTLVPSIYCGRPIKNRTEREFLNHKDHNSGKTTRGYSITWKTLWKHARFPRDGPSRGKHITRATYSVHVKILYTNFFCHSLHKASKSSRREERPILTTASSLLPHCGSRSWKRHTKC